MAKRLSHRVAVAVAQIIALGSSAAVYAQAALEEIVVTAERRETQLQDTPISLVAMSDETLQAKGVNDMIDLADFTPNLSIKAGRTGGNNAPVFSIRGIGGGGGATGERGVALYIDGIYVPRTSGSIFRVFDIERAEVLRGPQGTLFGRNSEGGAIRLFTKQPSQEFEAYVRATVGNFSHKDISGSVNIPLTDKLAIRAQAAYLDQDGFVKRGTQNLGGDTTKLGRLQIAYDFTDNVRLTLGGFYSDSHGTGSPQDIISFDLRPDLNYEGNNADWLRDAFLLAGQPTLALLNDPRVVLDDFTMPDFCFIDDFNPDWDKSCELHDDNKYTQVDANLQWDINDDVRLTSITGYSKLDHDSLSDNVLLGFNVGQDNVQSKSFYQEFQLNAALWGGKVDLVTGLNYFHEAAESSGYALQRRGTSVYSAGGGFANGDVGQDFVRRTNGTNTDQTADSYGWFSSLTWHATDKLNLTGGFRLAYDQKKITVERGPDNVYPAFQGDPPTPPFIPVPGTDSTVVSTSESWDAIDWRGTIDYHFTEDLMGYATVSRAYKAGAFPAFTFINCTTPAAPGTATCPTGEQQAELYSAIPPEQVTNYEAGFRAMFFERRLRINPTYYYMVWTDRQTSVRQPCDIGPNCTTGSNVFLRSTGDIDLEGLELDMQLALTDNLTVDGAFGTTAATIKDVVANGGPNLFPPQASPTWNLGATYQLRDTAVGEFTFNFNYSYTSPQETYPESSDPALLSDGSYLMPSYGISNARIQWTSKDRKNMVTLYANNLFDKTYENFATKFGGGFWDGFNSLTGIMEGLPGAAVAPGVGAPLRNMVSVTRSRPREIGLTYQYNF
ncbi:MAG: TonB-dependent receptor [Nevskiaceae bacterium]|jgi:iron complex outermembrane receptor protein|nr:TonB-dependent receptor [Nevskiaceae bacterium]